MGTPMILTAAIVGAEVTREQTPHLPITAEEIAREAKRCRDAGAAVIHLHVREPDGAPTQSERRFREAIEAIRAETDVIVQTSTGGAVGMGADERLQPLACRPEMATLNCGTTNFGDEVFENTRPMMREFARRIRASGATPELEIYEIGHLDAAMELAREGLIDKPYHVQFVLGIRGAAGARPSVLKFLVGELRAMAGDDATWAVAAVGRHQLPMAALAAEMGGHARVGLEDNIYLDKGVLSEGSAPLVERAATAARHHGRDIVDPPRARHLLGLRSP